MTTKALSKFKSLLADPATMHVGGVPDGYESIVLAEALKAVCEQGDSTTIVFIAPDGQRDIRVVELNRDQQRGVEDHVRRERYAHEQHDHDAAQPQHDGLTEGG